MTGRALDGQRSPIEGLYVVGSAAGMSTTGTGYNSGIALGRGLTLAYLVANQLSGTGDAAGADLREAVR